MAHLVTFALLLSLKSVAVFSEYVSDNVNVESISQDDVHFFLHTNTRNTSDCDELKYLDSDSLIHSRFHPSHPLLIVLVHGYTQNYTAKFPRLLRNAYLHAGYADKKANLISVDWGKLATPKDPDPIVLVGNLLQLTSYRQAMENVPRVG